MLPRLPVRFCFATENYVPSDDPLVNGESNPATGPRPFSAWTVAWKTGWLAAKQNQVPAVVMWLFGVAIVSGYFLVPAIHDGLNSAGEFKAYFGWKFSLVSTAIFGGLIPAFIARLINGRRQSAANGLLISNTLLWAYKGVEIDLFYEAQAWLFGTTPDFQTIAIKTICDQFVMVPAFGIVNVVLFYIWRDCGYSLRKFPAALGKHWYRRKVLPVMIANWVIWIPAVAMIYSLPVALQLPVQNLILCFWVLILMFFTQPAHDKHNQ